MKKLFLPFRRLLSGLRQQDGTAMLEIAIAMPSFFLLLFGLFEYSYALATYMSTVYATSMGVRYASTHSASSSSPATVAQIQAVVRANLLMPGSTSSGVIVQYGNRQGGSTNVGNYTGDLVGVGVYSYPALNMPFVHPLQSALIVGQGYRVITR